MRRFDSLVLPNLLAAVTLLLIFWFTRLPALDALPLHNDEGLHLTRAVQVWNGNPFWEIRDGKIINHWVIAALYPQIAPAFTGRIATLFVTLIGAAAGYALVRREFGRAPAVFAIAVWIFTPYLFFYERLAFSDAEAGALAVVALLAALRLARTAALRDALLTGLMLGLAILFKFTAAPYALSVALIVLLLSRMSLRRRVILLVVSAGVVTALFVVPVAYLLLRGSSLFDIALGWISGSGSGAEGLGAVGNGTRFVSLLWEFDGTLWLALIVGGVIALALYSRPRGLILLIAALLPAALMIVLAREVLPRHFAAALPLLVIVSAGALSAAHHARTRRTAFGVLDAVVIGVLVLSTIGFLRAAAVDPASMPLPDSVRAEHITDHSAGYGLREAVIAFPQTVPADVPIVASMFPDGCRRANFYAVDGREMICADAPGADQMRELLESHAMIYVLTDTAPLIGIDWAAYAEFHAEQVAVYARPGVTNGMTDVTLWRVIRTAS